MRIAEDRAAAVGEELDLDIARRQSRGDRTAELDVETGRADALATADRERDRSAEDFRIAELGGDARRQQRRRFLTDQRLVDLDDIGLDAGAPLVGTRIAPL